MMFLFRRSANCAEVSALSLEERANDILRGQVCRLREQLVAARDWNGQCARRMALTLEENGRLRCALAGAELRADVMEAQLFAGGPVS